MDYGLYDLAYKAIASAEGMEKRPSIFAMLVECNIAVGDVDDAIELLQAFKSTACWRARRGQSWKNISVLPRIYKNT